VGPTQQALQPQAPGDVHDLEALAAGPQSVQWFGTIALGTEGDQVDRVPFGEPAQVSPGGLVPGLPGAFDRQVRTEEEDG
jgi:hypothetical protein